MRRIFVPEKWERSHSLPESLTNLTETIAFGLWEVNIPKSL